MRDRTGNGFAGSEAPANYKFYSPLLLKIFITEPVLKRDQMKNLAFLGSTDQKRAHCRDPALLCGSSEWDGREQRSKNTTDGIKIEKEYANTWPRESKHGVFSLRHFI